MNNVSLPPVRPAGAAPATPEFEQVRVPDWLGILTFVLLHLGCLAVWWTGTTPAALILCAACYAVHMFGITAGFHRYFAHRSYKTSRPFQFVLGVLGCSALQKGPLWWVAQ